MNNDFSFEDRKEMPWLFVLNHTHFFGLTLQHIILLNSQQG